jgi:hypothetical protein
MKRITLTIRKVKETGEVDEDGNPIQLSDVEKEGDGGLGDEGLEDGGRVQEASAEVKAEVEAATTTTPTPKRKRAPAKPKANGAAKVEPDAVLDEKPALDDGAAVNGVERDQVEVAKVEVEDPTPTKAKAPPKKRAKKA